MPKTEKSTPGLDDDSEGLVWVWPAMTTNTNLFEIPALEARGASEDTFGDQCDWSFKQPLVQKMSMKMNSWLKHHEFTCLHETAFTVRVLGFFERDFCVWLDVEFLNSFSFFMNLQCLSGCNTASRVTFWSWGSSAASCRSVSIVLVEVKERFIGTGTSQHFAVFGWNFLICSWKRPFEKSVLLSLDEFVFFRRILRATSRCVCLSAVIVSSGIWEQAHRDGCHFRRGTFNSGQFSHSKDELMDCSLSFCTAVSVCKGCVSFATDVTADFSFGLTQLSSESPRSTLLCVSKSAFKHKTSILTSVDD